MNKLEIIPIEGLPEISPGDDLVEIIGQDGQVISGDILVITQKIVSKAENQIVKVDPDDPLSHKPLVEEESVRILRRRGDLIISETKHGFVCANAGIDLSNVERGQAALLPEDSDRSARRIRDGLKGKFNLDVGVIISDTFGRPWRRGLTDVAIGSSGVLPILDLRGSPDAFGREMQVTEVALVDELSSAAELVMGKSSGIPVAIIRGADESWFGLGSVKDQIIREPKDDLFR
ncbi:MAG: coenzyme F420-0:L-glutamate ligase [Acidimicrobiaceae bacterium]|nr:coenzyme F420-0:L-glutamate ligase [Acidimicrobiaceae bacterium]|tara:strand:- start:431 stop:1129 length:699 start_codon:yes stop_codon:yes gene_type:complete